MGEEEDPMAALNAMKAKMANMQQMAEVAQLQTQLAANVQSSMARIEQMLEPEPSVNGGKLMGDQDEVEEWRRKIAELSGDVAPAPTKAPPSAPSAPPVSALGPKNDMD